MVHKKLWIFDNLNCKNEDTLTLCGSGYIKLVVNIPLQVCAVLYYSQLKQVLYTGCLVKNGSIL